MRHTLVLLLLAISASAIAQFPERPLRIVVAFSTGTAADIVARQIALKLTDSLGKQVVVENRDGAAGTIGAGLAARATPDGHTLLIASAMPHIKSGRLKGLAVTSEKRSQAAPEIPALAETLPGYEAASWYGIIVPAQTPRAAITRLHTEITKTLHEPEVRQRLLSLGGDVVAGGPEELGRAMRGGAERWGKLVKEIETQGR